jgi:hypothetical protein
MSLADDETTCLCWCAGDEPPKFPWLTVLSAEVKFYADDMPLLDIASAFENAFPGRIAILAARARDRVSLAYDKMTCADVLGNIGLRVLEDTDSLDDILPKS